MIALWLSRPGFNVVGGFFGHRLLCVSRWLKMRWATLGVIAMRSQEKSLRRQNFGFVRGIHCRRQPSPYPNLIRCSFLAMEFTCRKFGFSGFSDSSPSRNPDPDAGILSWQFTTSSKPLLRRV